MDWGREGGGGWVATGDCKDHFIFNWHFTEILQLVRSGKSLSRIAIKGTTWTSQTRVGSFDPWIFNICTKICYMHMLLSQQRMLEPDIDDSYLPVQMFAFSCWSQRNWEVKCPGFLLAETGSAALPLAACKGTEVSRGFSSFDWPSPEQWGSNLQIEVCSAVQLGQSISE